MNNFVKNVHAKARNELEQVETTWNKLELPWTSWNYLEEARTTWDKVEWPGMRLTQQRSDKNRKFIGQNYVCYTTSQKTTLRAGFVKKCNMSDVFKCNRLEQNWTTDEVTHVANYVYNIISLQNITLQLTIVTKIFILDAGKLFKFLLCSSSYFYASNKNAQCF